MSGRTSRRRALRLVALTVVCALLTSSVSWGGFVRQPAVGGVRVLVEVIDPLGIEGGRAADQPMDFVAFFDQQLGQIRAVLAGDASDERRLRHSGKYS